MSSVSQHVTEESFAWPFSSSVVWQMKCALYFPLNEQQSQTYGRIVVTNKRLSISQYGFARRVLEVQDTKVRLCRILEGSWSGGWQLKCLTPLKYLSTACYFCVSYFMKVCQTTGVTTVIKWVDEWLGGLVQSPEPPLTVLHYEYLEWPDYYVPLSTRSVRELIRALFNIPPRAGPFVVHCRYTLFVLWKHRNFCLPADSSIVQFFYFFDQLMLCSLSILVK